MNQAQAVCNYALLQFLPYPETGEFVNVGVLVSCVEPCLLAYRAEKTMPERVRAMFPRQNEQLYLAAIASLQKDMERAQNSVHNAKNCQHVFGELVRRRESIFRFGGVRTILCADAHLLVDELFARYVRMEDELPAGAEVMLA